MRLRPISALRYDTYVCVKPSGLYLGKHIGSHDADAEADVIVNEGEVMVFIKRCKSDCGLAEQQC